MRMLNGARVLLLLGVIGLAVGAPGMASLARPKRQPVVEAPPPPPPPPPADPVGLPDRLLDDAAAYDGYMRAAIATSPAFSDANSVSASLKRSGAYAPQGLVRGAIAFGAIAALQEHDFVAALRDAGNTPEHRVQMVDYITANPAYVYLFAGAYSAAGRAREALGPSTLQLYTTGRTIKQSAYDIQKQAWSKAEVADLRGRLSGAEAQATSDMTPDPDRLVAMRQSVAGASAPPAPTSDTVSPAPPPYAPLVTRALQLAAIAALGEANDAALDRLLALAKDQDTQDCLAAAKRNFHQCLAVAKPNYEDIFCMGQHALRDTGACLAKATGYELPPEPLPPPSPPKAPVKKVIHKRRH